MLQKFIQSTYDFLLENITKTVAFEIDNKQMNFFIQLHTI